MKTNCMIAIILVLCMLASLTACMPSNLNPTDSQVPTTTAAAPATTPPATTTVPGPKTLNLADYDAGIDNTVINNDTIVNLLRQAESILEEYDIIEISYDSTAVSCDNCTRAYDYTLYMFGYTSWFMSYGGQLEGVSHVDGMITFDTASLDSERHEEFRYLIMCILMMQEYEGLWYNRDHDYVPKSVGEREYMGALGFCPSFRDSDYDNIEQFYNDVKNKKYAVEDGGSVYCLYFGCAYNNRELTRFFISEWPVETTIVAEWNIYDEIIKEAFPEE